jgi:hypothetical protein
MSLQIQGPEQFEQFTIPAPAGVLTPQEFTTQKELRKDKYIWGMLVEVLFHVRATTGAATPLIFNDEFPLNIIDRWRIEGSKVNLGVREFMNVSGATLQRYCNLFKRKPGVVQVSFMGGALMQVIGNGLGVQNSTPNTLFGNPVKGGGAPTGDGTAVIASSVSNDFDIRIVYLIPMAPLGIPIAQQAIFMLKGTEWETLNFHFTFGDQSSLFDNRAGSTFAFGAFGSGVGDVTGNPLVNIHLLRPNMGMQRNKINPALPWRTFQNLNTTLQATNLTNGQIARLSVTPDKYVRNVVKTGVLPNDAMTPGVSSVINGLTDDIITQPLIKISGKPIRNPYTTAAAKEWIGEAHGVEIPTGYSLNDFSELGNVNTYVSVKGLTKDDFTLEGNVTAGGNQVGEIFEERLEGESTSNG